MMDKGPWVIHKSATGIWHVCSDDSTHDVTLDIMGDFGKGEAKQYVEWLANELNDCAALRAENERLREVVEAIKEYDEARSLLSQSDWHRVDLPTGNALFNECEADRGLDPFYKVRAALKKLEEG